MFGMHESTSRYYIYIYVQMYRIDVLGSKMRVKIFNYIDDNLKIN